MDSKPLVQITLPIFTPVMKADQIAEHICNWLQKQLLERAQKGFVVGVSGGIDSAVTSTLCAMTKAPTLVVSLPIRQQETEWNRASEHMNWLKQRYANVDTLELNLEPVWNAIEKSFSEVNENHLVMANTRSRLRMLALYAFAGSRSYLVAGTGNKVEDFGIGFFTKYGDGGVDLSPIADLFKSEVYALGHYLNLCTSILQAAPTDGLFADGRTDEDQIGASYDELEWAMKLPPSFDLNALSERERWVWQEFTRRNRQNAHKMQAIPVCTIPEAIKY